jgi:hypothetical protein
MIPANLSKVQMLKLEEADAGAVPLSALMPTPLADETFIIGIAAK